MSGTYSTEVAEVINISALLQTENIQIPTYQRPYKWSVQNVNQLIDDILFSKEKSAYRLGTIVFHKEEREGKKILNIVDGQQRFITVLLIALALNRKENQEDKLSKKIEFYSKNIDFSNKISQYNIKRNYDEIQRRVGEFDKKEIDFFFEKCEFVKVEIDDVSEAFQFFDSQNARGKDLEPHDLLKAYHLRALSYETKDEKIIKNIVKEWESVEDVELRVLFSDYLFRIKNWSQEKSARFFTKQEIHVFKGINLHEEISYPYAAMHKIAHFFTDDYNLHFSRNIDKQYRQYPFQIDQPIINGKRFFESIAYYLKMKNHLKEVLQKHHEKIYAILENYSERYYIGDKYVRNLFDCALLYYWDRFGEVDIKKMIEKTFAWAYKLRLEYFAVQRASMDNYARQNLKIFNLIKYAIFHDEVLNNMNVMPTTYVNKADKRKEIQKMMEKLNYLKKDEQSNK
ncbi:DUF262 domain-containing protein [Ornithobacterium rhinotracheale]|uniref:DUF262 domain-containing protein n=1 Tax=Ornithobacterium rhinotracheale TaxID=28251 RepID=UPI00403750DD